MAGEEDGLVRFDRQCSLYKLMLGIKSANLNLWASRPLDKEELDSVRAAFIRRACRRYGEAFGRAAEIR